jgi:uncharacterized protein (TIGR00299 family) protein
LKIAYFDCFSGISGDMCLGAIVDAGVPIKELERKLEKLPVRGYTLTSKKVNRSHITANKVSVLQKEKGMQSKTKRWKDIQKIIQDSSFSRDIKEKGLKIFRRLFEAEARVHGKTTVHLHELGAVDCIVDIFGTLAGLNMLGIEKVCASAVNLGSGFVKTESGMLPVPAPATAEILRKIPVYSRTIQSELTTPTGAAILRELASEFGDMPRMDIEKIGAGAGDKNFKDWPNVLRIFIGNSVSPDGRSDDCITVIETNVDDMNPQIFEYVMERLFKAGALDVFLTQTIMKKGRPGVKLTVLCNKVQQDSLMKIIFKETSTIGLRFYETGRRVLQREIKTADTQFGKVMVKVSKLGDNIVKASPEYEDCKKIAKKLDIPLIEVMKKLMGP